MHSVGWPGARSRIAFRVLNSIRQGGRKSFLLSLYACMFRGHLLQMVFGGIHTY